MFFFRAKQEPELPLGLSYDELPAWMRKPHREVDWALLLVGVLCLIIVWPLIVRPGLPWNAGTHMELSRAIEMAESLDEGNLYPRWASNFNYGYGSPLWNYLAPLPRYLTGLHYLLAQSNPETSVKIATILGITLAGWGMFGFARHRWGIYAGVLATALYLCSPQLAFVKPYLQSDLAATLAMGLFPSTLWAIERVLSTGRGRDVALVSLAMAALWLADGPLNVLWVGIIIGWLVWRWLMNRYIQEYWGRAIWGIVLGISLSAFYWLPAWVERHAVRWLPAVSETPQPLSVQEMLSWPHLLDLSAINPAPPQTIGFPIWVLALVGLCAVGLWRRVAPHRYREGLYFLLIGAGLFMLLILPDSAFWDRLLPSWLPVQTDDFLPVLVACGAMAAAQVGYFLEHLPHARYGAVGMTVCMGFVALTSLPVFYPAPWPESRSVPGLSTILRDEARGYMVASLTEGWLLPRTVEKIPEPSPVLLASYQTEQVDKVARDQLPAAVQADIIEHDANTERLVVDSVNPVMLPLNIHFFPGWQAKIDGDTAKIVAAPQTGLITVQVPAGHHEVTVYLGTTQVRTISWLISGIALLALVLIGVRLEYLAANQSLATEETHKLPSPLPGTLFIVGLIFVGGAVTVRLVPERFTIRSSVGTVLDAQQFPRWLQGGIDLLAYDVETDGSLKPGETLDLTLYWRATRPDLPDYQVGVKLVAADGSERHIGHVQRRHPGMIPTSQWAEWPLLDYYVRDAYHLAIARDALPGTYNIVIQVGRCGQVNLLPCENIEPLSVWDGRGASLGQNIILPAQVEVQN